MSNVGGQTPTSCCGITDDLEDLKLKCFKRVLMCDCRASHRYLRHLSWLFTHTHAWACMFSSFYPVCKVKPCPIKGLPYR